MLDWQSNESHIFINPRMPSHDKNKLEYMLQKFKLDAHIFLATSGSTAIQSTDTKWVALKKSVFLTSARSVNQHLNCSKKDTFLNTLPPFHVGGLALFARAYLCEAQIIDLYHEDNRWNPKNFVQQLLTNKVTISSLVPTQVYDLVHNQLSAPPSLRFIVVGGGFLDQNLYEQARKLNWPLLPSYGMTECGSQIATASPNFAWHSGYPELTVLPHLDVSLTAEGKIEISGDSLLSCYILQTQDKVERIDPKIDGKIITSDIGEFKNNKLLIYGRMDENIKINGENISLVRLQEILQQIANHSDCAIISLPDARQGNKIAAVFLRAHTNVSNFVNLFNERVFPYERIAMTYYLDKIPRTELGKLKRNLITQEICQQ